MVFKEHIYAWYPQVDIPDYTAAKPSSDEVESLYRGATNYHLEKPRPPDNSVPTIGFRINRKTAQEEEGKLSPVEFLRRCKSAPLQREPCDEVSPRELTKGDATPKPETKIFLAVPNTEHLTNEVSATPHLQSPRQNPSKVRPFSASLATEKKSDVEQCARKLSSARINRQVKVQRNGDSPVIVVTPPAQNNNIPKSPLLKSPPGLSSSIPAPRDIFPNPNNGVLGPRNSARSCSYRPRITSTEIRARGRVNSQNSNNKENIKNSGYRNVLRGVSITGVNVVGLGEKPKGDNSKINVQIEVSRPSEANSEKPEGGSSESACANKADVRELAIKEIRRYDSEDYERELRQNGWRMEVPGNKFGLKKTPIRLPYWMPLVVPQVPEQPPVFYTNAPSTFFYNTIPSRPKRMTIAQNWHSEIGYEQRLVNINRKRRGYHYRNWSFVY